MGQIMLLTTKTLPGNLGFYSNSKVLTVVICHVYTLRSPSNANLPHMDNFFVKMKWGIVSDCFQYVLTFSSLYQSTNQSAAILTYIWYITLSRPLTMHINMADFIQGIQSFNGSFHMHASFTPWFIANYSSCTNVCLCVHTIYEVGKGGGRPSR